MKKHHVAKLLFCMVFLFAGFSMKAAECGKAVDVIVEAFIQVSQTVKSYTSFDQFESLNIDTTSMEKALEDVPDECAEEPLTQGQKDRIKKSYDELIDSMAEKCCELGGPILPRDVVDQQFTPLKEEFHKIVNEATNLNELVEYMENL